MKSYSIERVRSGSEMESVVESHFRARGYEVLRGFRIRTWRADLVMTKGDEVVIVEAKGVHGDLRMGVAQTAIYATDATMAFLAVPPYRVTDELRQWAKVLGIGLLAVDDTVRVVQRPKRGRARPVLMRRLRAEFVHASGGTPIADRKPRAPSLYRFVKHRPVLKILLKDTQRRFTTRALATESGTPYATTWRVVDDLRSLGVISSEKVGSSQYLSVNRASPLVSELQRLQTFELTPHRTAAQEFVKRIAGLSQVRRVVLFGSAAEGRAGINSDVDIAVIVNRRNKALETEIYGVVADVQDRTGMSVTPTFVTSSEARTRKAFTENLKKGEVLFARA